MGSARNKAFFCVSRLSQGRSSSDLSQTVGLPLVFFLSDVQQMAARDVNGSHSIPEMVYLDEAAKAPKRDFNATVLELNTILVAPEVATSTTSP